MEGTSDTGATLLRNRGVSCSFPFAVVWHSVPRKNCGPLVKSWGVPPTSNHNKKSPNYKRSQLPQSSPLLTLRHRGQWKWLLTWWQFWWIRIFSRHCLQKLCAQDRTRTGGVNSSRHTGHKSASLKASMMVFHHMRRTFPGCCRSPSLLAARYWHSRTSPSLCSNISMAAAAPFFDTLTV